MKISVSELLTHQTCPTKRWFQYTQKIRARRDERALTLGIAFHDMMAEALRAYGIGALQPGEPETWMGIITKRLVNDWRSREIDPDDKKNIETLRQAQALAKWAWWFWQPGNHPKWKEVLAVETPLQMNWGKLHNGDELIVMGRIDGIVRDEERRIWHLQWKTLAASAKVNLYVRRIKRSLHEALYQDLIRDHYPNEEYMGTRLQVFQKLPIRARVGGHLIDRPCSDAITGIDLNINGAQAERARRDIHRLANRILLENAVSTQVDEAPDLEQREAACLGPYGNYPCAFLDVCDGFTGYKDPSYFESYDPYSNYEEDSENEV